jgi:hypothetical protein
MFGNDCAQYLQTARQIIVASAYYRQSRGGTKPKMSGSGRDRDRAFEQKILGLNWTGVFFRKKIRTRSSGSGRSSTHLYPEPGDDVFVFMCMRVRNSSDACSAQTRDL